MFAESRESLCLITNMRKHEKFSEDMGKPPRCQLKNSEINVCEPDGVFFIQGKVASNLHPPYSLRNEGCLKIYLLYVCTPCQINREYIVAEEESKYQEQKMATGKNFDIVHRKSGERCDWALSIL